MGTQAPAVPGDKKGGRKRKAHTKSRSGCKNCKIRGVKCDETKPSCERCKSYGAACSYNLQAPALEMVFDGTATIKTTPTSRSLVPSPKSAPLHPVQPFFCPAVYSDDSKYCFRLTSDELGRLGRFQTRTILAIGNTKVAKYFQHIIVGLACASPCLMHVILTLTSIHDRYLSGPITPENSRLTISERYHLGQAAKLLNEELSGPIQPDHRDALWATAALIGATAWSTIEASKPEEAWPLSPPDPSDLEWINMSENKSAIWELTQPLRPDSIFAGLAVEYEKAYLDATEPPPGIDGIPKDFVKLYNLTEHSNVDNHPYFSAVGHLALLLHLPCTRDHVGPFITWIIHLKPTFKSLLENKDPRAMLLLAYWFMKISGIVWSLERRSKLECQAICIYLRRYHWLDRDLMQMLQTPSRWCGARAHGGTVVWALFTGQTTEGV